MVILGDGPLVAVPDFSGWAARRIAQECAKIGLELNVVGSGLAVEQNPGRGNQGAVRHPYLGPIGTVIERSDVRVITVGGNIT